MQLVINGKKVGELRGGTLVKRGKQVVLFNTFDGFGQSVNVLDNPQVKDFELHYQGRVYKASVLTYKSHGIPYIRHGYEPQLILPRKYFTVHIASQMVML